MEYFLPANEFLYGFLLLIWHIISKYYDVVAAIFSSVLLPLCLPNLTPDLPAEQLGKSQK